jgi:hypothetical protein
LFVSQFTATHRFGHTQNVTTGGSHIQVIGSGVQRHIGGDGGQDGSHGHHEGGVIFLFIFLVTHGIDIVSPQIT